METESMSETNNYSPGEMMYAFLDGEATATQRYRAVSAMASDGALQDEFQDALRIRTAALREAKCQSLPPH